MAMVMLIVVDVTRWIDASDNDVVTQLDRIPAKLVVLVILGGIVGVASMCNDLVAV